MMRWVTIQSLLSRAGRVISMVGPLADQRERAVVSVPGFESLPLASEKSVEIDAGRHDGSVVFGVAHPETDLEPGERRIYATDSTGKRVSSLTMRADGSIEIETDGSVTICGTDWKSHTHDATTIGSPAGACTGITGGVSP